MSIVLVNATSAKMGGARTILESFVSSINPDDGNCYVVVAGYDASSDDVPRNVTWVYKPRGGIRAIAYSMFGVVFTCFRLRTDFVVSLNNVNCIVLSRRKKITYFHQLKTLDSSLSEPKLKIYRTYFRFFKEPVVVQSPQVKKDFYAMFGEKRREVVVAWPGIEPSVSEYSIAKKRCHVLVPVASPQSGHKNFNFVVKVAQELGVEWKVSVTAPKGSVEPCELNNIEMVGFKSRVELFDLYRTATCVLMPSTHETIGLPIFEAMSTGTPVVAYDAEYIRGFKEWFGISKGLLLASDANKAGQAIRRCQTENINVFSDQDFCKSEWYKIFNMLKK